MIKAIRNALYFVGKWCLRLVNKLDEHLEDDESSQEIGFGEFATMTGYARKGPISNIIEAESYHFTLEEFTEICERAKDIRLGIEAELKDLARLCSDLWDKQIKIENEVERRNASDD